MGPVGFTQSAHVQYNTSEVSKTSCLQKTSSVTRVALAVITAVSAAAWAVTKRPVALVISLCTGVIAVVSAIFHYMFFQRVSPTPSTLVPAGGSSGGLPGELPGELQGASASSDDDSNPTQAFENLQQAIQRNDIAAVAATSQLRLSAKALQSLWKKTIRKDSGDCPFLTELYKKYSLPKRAGEFFVMHANSLDALRWARKNRVDFTEQSGGFDTPLLTAAILGKASFVQYLVEELHIEVPKNLFSYAATSCDAETIEYALSLNPQAANQLYSGLFFNEMIPSSYRPEKPNLKKIEQACRDLQSKGYDINDPKYNRRPLAFSLHGNMLALYQKMGGNLNVIFPETGETPLHHRVSSANLLLRDIDLFMQAGVKWETADKDGKTPLHEYVRGMPLLHMHTSHEHFRQAIFAHCRHILNAPDSRGCTPLMVAVQQGAPYRIINEEGIYFDAKDTQGNTALHHAAHNCVHFKSMIHLLVTKGATITIKNNQGETPLMLGCRLFPEHMADFLFFAKMYKDQECLRAYQAHIPKSLEDEVDRDPKGYFRILEMDPNTPEESFEQTLKKCYRTLAVKLHPDKRTDGNQALFQGLHEAYEFLLEPKNRRTYGKR